MNGKKSTRRALRCVLCLCVLLLLVGCGKHDSDPGYVQVVNPLVTVGSVSEMEEQLGYAIPVLEKAVDAYIVLLIDGIAESGRILYADDSDFNIKRGSGDVSGIYGGELVSEEMVDGVLVSFFVFEEFRYAIWEKDGMAYSLTGGAQLEEDVAALIGIS